MRRSVETTVPVLALFRLYRHIEYWENKRPLLSDLNTKYGPPNSIEQDADVVMLMFREEYYLEHDRPVQWSDEANNRFMDRFDKWERDLEAATRALGGCP